jgi:hypothetical protein
MVIGRKNTKYYKKIVLQRHCVYQNVIGTVLKLNAIRGCEQPVPTHRSSVTVFIMLCLAAFVSSYSSSPIVFFQAVASTPLQRTH